MGATPENDAHRHEQADGHAHGARGTSTAPSAPALERGRPRKPMPTAFTKATTVRPAVRARRPRRQGMAMSPAVLPDWRRAAGSETAATRR